jgi:hypothetical protein
LPPLFASSSLNGGGRRVPSKLVDAKSAFTELGQYSGAERRAFENSGD